jgi:hypothetical protein
MTLRFAILPAALATALIGAGVAGVASADPAPDGSGCTFTLSSPQRVQVSGVDMVTATVSSYPCVGDAVPQKTVACLELQGSGSPGQCAQQNPQDQPAQVYFSPYRPGSTYVSTGTGCSGLFTPPYTACVSLGPKTARL